MNLEKQINHTEHLTDTKGLNYKLKINCGVAWFYNLERYFC